MEIVDKYKELNSLKKETGAKAPSDINIIYIMSESFTDPKDFTDVYPVSGDMLKYTTKLISESTGGRVAVSEFGGGTSNVEFEALTGFSNTFTSGNMPYNNYLAKDNQVPSIVSLLKPLGIDRLVPGSIDFLPGPAARSVPVDFEGLTLNMGVQICYEIVFSGEVVDRANRPDFIFNPSNDAWFGSWGPPQHLAQARLRAIEEGLPVIRATPTGISAVIDADGRIRESLPMYAAGRIDTVVPPAHAPTLFARHGNILPVGFALILLAAAIAFRRRGR